MGERAWFLITSYSPSLQGMCSHMHNQKWGVESGVGVGGRMRMHACQCSVDLYSFTLQALTPRNGDIFSGQVFSPQLTKKTQLPTDMSTGKPHLDNYPSIVSSHAILDCEK